MQPRKLILQNFGPFIHETIDFSGFEGNGLFLISGKTGAGKTTIFDSMSYALFGETTGQQRSGKEMRSIFASPDEATKVTFLFEHQGFYYEVARSPEQTLSKKRGTGTTEQASKVTLTVYNGQMQEQRQLTKRQEVEAFIQDLLQLNAKQFFQIILLPQGEFRNFLIAPSSDKEKLLRNVFGTNLYQRLTDWLNEQQKQQQQNLKEQEKKIELLSEGFKWPEEKELALTVAEQLTQWTAAQAGLEAAIQMEETKQADLETKRNNQEKAYYAAQTLAKRLAEYHQLQADLALLKTQRAEVEEQEAHLRFLRQLEKDAVFLKQLEQARLTLATQQDQQAVIQAQLVTFSQNQADWANQASAMAEKATKIEALALKKQELQRLMPLVDQMKAAVLAQTELQQTLAKTQQQFAKIQTQQADEKAVAAALEKEIAQKATFDQEALELKQIETTLARHEENQGTLENLTTTLAKGTQASTEFAQACTDFETQAAEKEQAFLHLQSEWAKLQIEKWQQLLIPGEPCLVCGSTTHPILAQADTAVKAADITVTEEKVEAAQQAWQQVQSQWQRAKENLKVQVAKNELLEQNYQQQLASQAVLGTQLQAQLQVRDGAFRQAFAQRTQAWQENQAKMVAAQAQLVKIQAKISEFTQALDEGQEEMQTLQTQCIQQDERVRNLANQFDQISSEGVEEEFHQVAAKLTEMTQALTAYQALGQALEKEHVALLERQAGMKQQFLASEAALKAHELAFNSLLASYPVGTTEASLLEQQVDLGQMSSLEQAVQSYRERWQFLTTRLAQEADLAGQVAPDLTQLEATFAATKAQLLEQQKHVLQQKEQWQHNANLVEQVQALYEQTQAAFAELAQMEQLSQTMRGDNVQRLSFERYLLQTYLTEVLEVANHRLIRLTRGRYQFLISSEKGSYRSSTGLEINIYDDNAGALRRAQTLSGGESFIAALALALSLADVIQQQAGGIAIEALFIDEGFGSLDEDSLEMALEALEMIEQEGRLIGIISHVRELKERIFQQLIVETNGNGQSKTKLKLGERWDEA